jgi:hypothetical protein
VIAVRICAVDTVNLEGTTTRGGVKYDAPSHVRVHFELSHAECDLLNRLEGHSHLGERLQRQLGDAATVVSRRNIGLRVDVRWDPHTESIDKAVKRARECVEAALTALREAEAVMAEADQA